MFFPSLSNQRDATQIQNFFFIYIEVHVTNFFYAENQSSKSKPQFVKFYVSQDKYQYNTDCEFRIGKIAELKVQNGCSEIFFSKNHQHYLNITLTTIKI